MAVKPLALRKLEEKSKNIYEAVVVMSKRARQINQERYEEKVMNDQFFTARGFHLSQDDKIRQKLIRELSCAGEVLFSDYEKEYGINFADYFAYGLEQMRLQEQDELVELTDNSIKVLPQGRLLLRIICMAFDAYLEPGKTTQKFSKII